MTRHIQGGDRAQTLLLPASVEDYVGAGNPVRAIEAFVAGFDLARAGFVRAAAKDTGRPGYHPGDLLKLYLYGYLNRIRSSRRLEAETHRNLEVMWLLRGLRPDFKTIAEQEVTNLGSDLDQLAPTAITAKEALGVETIQVTADRGYYKSRQVQPACSR